MKVLDGLVKERTIRWSLIGTSFWDAERCECGLAYVSATNAPLPKGSFQQGWGRGGVADAHW